MDLTNINGINVPLVAGIIGTLFTVKRLDTKGFFGRKFYIIAVFIMGMIGGMINAEHFVWNYMITGGLIHAGVASILYQTGKLLVPGENKFFNKKGKETPRVIQSIRRRSK